MAARRLAVIPAILLASSLLGGCFTYVIDAQTMRTVTVQEDGFLSDGDEPYIATIWFRSTPGKADSTEVAYLGNLQELSSGADDGDVLAIPDAMGRSQFDDVVPRNAANVLQGHLPEVLGVVTVAVESDLSPWSAINGIMGDVRDELDHQLRLIIEPKDLSGLLDVSAMADELAAAADAVQAAAEPSFWEAVGLWFQSFGNPDDVIGFDLQLYVAATGDLADAVDAAFAGTLPAGVHGGALREGTVEADFVGDGAHYTVSYDISRVVPDA